METLPFLSARQRRGGMQVPWPLRQDSARTGGRVERRRVRRVGRCMVGVFVEGGGVGRIGEVAKMGEREVGRVRGRGRGVMQLLAGTGVAWGVGG